MLGDHFWELLFAQQYGHGLIEFPGNAKWRNCCDEAWAFYGAWWQDARWVLDEEENLEEDSKAPCHINSWGSTRIKLSSFKIPATWARCQERSKMAGQTHLFLTTQSWTDLGGSESTAATCRKWKKDLQTSWPIATKKRSRVALSVASCDNLLVIRDNAKRWWCKGDACFCCTDRKVGFD